MTAFTTEKIDVEPWFDMELFMGVSQETAAEGACRIEHVISAETFEKLKEHVAGGTAL